LGSYHRKDIKRIWPWKKAYEVDRKICIAVSHIQAFLTLDYLNFGFKLNKVPFFLIDNFNSGVSGWDAQPSILQLLKSMSFINTLVINAVLKCPQ